MVLSRYFIRAFLSRFVLLLIGVAVTIQILDLLATAEDILAGAGNDILALYRYMALKLPIIVSDLVPFTALLASLILFATLAQASEIIVLKASGRSPAALLMPLVYASAIVAAGHFLFNEIVTVNSARALRTWQAQDYRADALSGEETAAGVWMTDGLAIVYADTVSRTGDLVTGVEINRRDEAGNVTEVWTADQAHYEGGYWTLDSVTTWNVESNVVSEFESLPWTTSTTPDEFLLLAIDPQQASFFRLLSYLAEASDGPGGSVRIGVVFRTWLHEKLAGPLGSVVLPILASLVAFGLYRGGGQALRFLIGMGLGFAYFVIDNLMVALGTYGTLPPPLAAWFPNMLFLLIGAGIVVYTES